MSLTSLVFGGSGFVGRRLTERLLARGDRVWVADRVLHGGAGPDHMACDVREDPQVAAAIDRAAPDVVFHLAGISSVPDAERAPLEAYDVNTLGSVRIARALAARRPDATLLVIGSGTQYGPHPAAEMPLAESAEQRPVNVYSATKAAQEIAVMQVARATGLRAIATRSFNHSGRGQPATFLLPALVERARSLSSRERALPIGNDVVRDYLHVDDVVRAYLALVERGRSGEIYNVCSGTGISVRELAAAVLRAAGSRAEVVADQSLARASDIPWLVGSPAKIQADTGWTPARTHRDIIADLLRSA